MLMCSDITHVTGLTTRMWPPSSPKKIRSASQNQTKQSKTYGTEVSRLGIFREDNTCIQKKTPESEPTPSDGLGN